ncbi:Trp biosynthesis-associated membrane protein [Lysinibacter sp. HNR]|uniref:Trp biosynthesis-associated membrane protein n=1 Tax=Lysinibacter sp. HNR TaxID=3031408 RepID=UPI0024360278|nr:Trp biosynthesis-associated membrane protein [Lysinibacter sp. HNR]WGD36355.1 Trp biosynthesis-associated membrane protein [Lysinibacter sp. HNR]
MTASGWSATRIKRWIILLVLASNALLLLAWSQTWFTLTLRPDVAGEPVIAVTGQQAAAALSAFALAGLAAGGALTIAGGAFRFILGFLQTVLGACAVWVSLSALSSPITGGQAFITAQTGVTGIESLSALVESVTTTAWPVLGIVIAVFVALSGVAVLVTARRWPRSSRRYQAVVLEPDESSAEAFAELTRESGESDPAAGDRIDEWDRQSRGSDPSV